MNRNLIVTLDAQKSSFVHKCASLESSGLAPETLASESAACQLLFNLIRDESEVLNQIEKAIEKPQKLKAVGIKSKLKGLLGIGMTFKSRNHEKNTKSFKELTEDWTHVRMKLDEVDMLDDSVLSQAIYHHPNFGAMHYGHVLTLLHKNFNKFLTLVSPALK